jgi:hypothetical protein
MTKRVLIGKFPDGGYGMRVSEPGYDVTSNPVNNERLVFSSDWQSLLPIHAVGTISVNNSTASANFADLGYIPHSSSLVKVLTSGWPSDWQQYGTTNSIVRPTETYGIVGSTVNMSQLYDFGYEEDDNDRLQINVKSNMITVFSNLSVQVYYTIYKLVAF